MIKEVRTLAGWMVVVQLCNACDGTTPLEAPPIVLRAHIAGSVRDAAGAAVSGVEVTIACPIQDSLAAYPASAQLAETRASDNAGTYDSWTGIDALTLQQAGRPVANLTVPCAVRARRNGLTIGATPSTVAVEFVPATQTPPTVPLNLQLAT